MSSLFDHYHRTHLQPAIDRTFGDAVTVAPMVTDQYTGQISDVTRPGIMSRAKVSLLEQEDKLDGARRGGELSGMTRISTMKAELWMQASDYDALGFDLVQNDRIQAHGLEGEPWFYILGPHRGTHSDFFCDLVVVPQ